MVHFSVPLDTDGNVNAGLRGFSSMRRLLPPPSVEHVIDGLERRPEMKKTLVITACAAVLIVVAATTTLGVLTASAGQQSGLHRCAKLSPV
jgi:hypothetical protein